MKITKVSTKLLSVLTALCVAAALFPVTAFAAGDNYIRKVVYSDSNMENFAFEVSGNITTPVAVFVYGNVEDATYELTQEDVNGHLVLAGIDAAFGINVIPSEDFRFDLLAEATITLGELKATANPNPSYDGTDFNLITAAQVAQGLMYADLYGCITSAVGTSCTSGGGFTHVKIGNDQTWTVPANESLEIVLYLDVNGELRGTDETSLLVFHNWGYRHAQLLGDGLTLYADIGEPRLLEITADNWDDTMAQGGDYFMPVFRWQKDKWLFSEDYNNPEPPAPSENQFRIFWDGYIPEGGSEAVARYKIGNGNEEVALMDVLTDIDAGADLTFIYTPAKDVSGNPETFWGIEVCFEGEEPRHIEKENLTENDGTYYYTVDRTGNSAGLTVGALRNSPHGGGQANYDINGDGVIDILDLLRLKKIIVGLVNDEENLADLNNDGEKDALDIAVMKRILLNGQNEPSAPSENQFRLFWDDYIPENGIEAVARYKIGNGNEEGALMDVLTDIDEGASLTFIYTPARDVSGNPEPFWGIEVCFEGEEPRHIEKEYLTENDGTYSYTVDRTDNSAGLTVGALRNSPHSGPFGDKVLDGDFIGGREYDNVITNEFTWTVPAGGDENKLIVRDNLTVSPGGSLVGTDNTSKLEIQTVTKVKGIPLYWENGTDLMNDISTGELSGVDGFGQWIAFNWQSDKWVLADNQGGRQVNYDINGDGVVDILDLVRLKKIIAKLAKDEKNSADLNSDGKKDALDVTVMGKNLL